MDNKPIPLRGHHLSRISGLDMDIGKYGKLMVETGYSEHESDSFVTQTYTFLQNLREHPNQRILVIAEEPDFICERCPKRKEKCVDYNPQASLLHNTVFCNQRKDLDSKDREFVKKVGLEVGEIYLVRQIIKATEEQTKDFRLSLEN